MNKRSEISLIILIAVSFLFSAVNVSAQQTRTLTYEDAIEIALNRSYTMKSFQANLQAMEYSFDFYKATFKPKIDLSMFAPTLDERVAQIPRSDGLPVYNSTGMTRFGSDLKFTYILPTGGNFALSSQLYRENLKTVLALDNYRELKTDQAYSSISLSFDQPIFTKNTLKENLDEARFRYERSSSQFTRGQMDIIYDVSLGFYSLYRATRELEIALEKLNNSEEAYRVAKLKNESGRIPEGDVLIAEVDVGQNRAALLEKEGNLEREKDNFKQFIGLDQDDKITIITDLQYETFDIDPDKAVEVAQKNRFEIYESELNIKLQEISVDRAERIREFKGEISAYYDITGVSTTGTGSSRELFESSFDNFVDRPPNRGVKLTFSYPVFDWGRGKSRVQEETVRLKERNLSLDNTKRTIVKGVKDTVRRVNEASSRLEIHEKNQTVAQRSYEISRLRFENGNITSQELGREQERLAETQLQYLNAFITYQLSVNDLKRKTLWDFKNNRSYLIN